MGSDAPDHLRTLGLPPDPQLNLRDSLAVELDRTYREVARRLGTNPDVRFEKVKGKEELILTPLDAMDEAPSLIQLRKVVAERLPRVELAELVLEVALRTGFTQALTHLTDRSARTADFALSLCAAASRGGLQHGTGTVHPSRHAGAAPGTDSLGQAELSARRNN